MKTVQKKVAVGADRMLTVQLPEDVTAGEYYVTMVLRPTEEESPRPAIMADWPVFEANLNPPDRSLRREDLYDDDGR